MAGSETPKNEIKNEVLQPQTFSCLNCGASLEITALGISNSVACGKCSTLIDITHPIYRVVAHYKKVRARTPKLPLGLFGKIRGNKWKIIGFMVREDSQYSVEWTEYLLYNPFLGYRFLMEMDDHYTFIQRLNFDPLGATGDSKICVNEFEFSPYGNFQIFHRGKAKVKFIAGEFYWRAKLNEVTEVEDFICPPYVFSIEKSRDEVNFSLGEYLPPSEILAAFSLPAESLPAPYKACPQEPNPYQRDFAAKMTAWGLSAGGLTALLILGAVTYPTQVIQKFHLAEPELRTANKVYVSPSFPLTDRRGNIQAEIQSPLNNQWLEADIHIVNEDSGENFSIETGVEYYSGIDAEGSWSEGDFSNYEIISGVPSGNYHLELMAQSDMVYPQVDVTLKRHGSMIANFIIGFLLISFYPLWMIWRRRAFEVERWEQSDFSPYPSNSIDSGSILNTLGEVLDDDN